MYVKVYKEILSNKNFISKKMTFPTITYIMMSNNFYSISYFSIGNIMDYFNIQRTTKNLNDIIECLEVLEAEGYINLIYGKAIDKKMNSLFGYEVKVSSELFVQFQDFEISKIISIYNNFGSYLFANVFMILKLRSFANPSNIGKVTESVTISYSALGKECDISSMTTIGKYIKLLCDSNVFTIEEDVKYSVKEGKQIFKKIFTYYFAERDK